MNILRYFLKICFKLYFSVVFVLYIYSLIYLLAYFDLFIFVTRLTLYSFCGPGGPKRFAHPCLPSARIKCDFTMPGSNYAIGYQLFQQFHLCS